MPAFCGHSHFRGSNLSILSRVIFDLDTTPPSIPSNVIGTPISSSRIDLAWAASVDTGGSGMAGYLVFRNGVQVGTASTTAYSDTGLAAATAYAYQLAAVDGAGNVSVQSTAISVTTLTGVGFAANRPSGLNTILDRQFDPTDSAAPGGTIPPTNITGTDSFGMSWNPSFGPAPIVGTPTALSTAIGVTIPALPDGHPTAIAVKYNSGLPAGNTPFFCSLGGFPLVKHLYVSNWVLMPSNFNSNGNNIKWLFFAGGDSRNHVLMLSSGSVGSYRGPWCALQGGGGNQNVGGNANTQSGATLNLATPTFNASTTWVCAEWELILESNPGVTSDGVLRIWIGGTKVVEFLNMKYNAVADAKGFNEFNWEPFYGGGGSAAPTNEFLCVGRLLCAGA